MNRYKIRMIIAALVAIILLVYMIVPMFSMAENEELNVNLTRVEINGGYQINVTGSSPSKILALTYITERKTVSDFNNNAEAIIAYFEGDKSNKLNITSGNYIDEVINVTKYGDYTVYLRNESGEIQLAYITINDKAAISLEATLQENADSKSILIKASSTSNISSVKVLKTNDATTPANFTNADNILDAEKNPVELVYPIIENGIYQVFVQDANKNKKIQTVNIFNGDSPISINTTVNGKTITINVEDCISNVQTIKIAPKDRINSIADFDSLGTNISFEGTTNITTSYEINNEGIYIVYVKDAAGSSYMKSVTVSSTPDQSIHFYKLANSNVIYVVAADSNNKINFAKYIISDEQKTLEDVRDNGTQLSFVEGQCVTLKISAEDLNNKFVSVYVSDILGYGKMVGISSNAIQVANEIPGVVVEPSQTEIKDEPNTQPEQQPEIKDEPNTQPEQQPEIKDEPNTQPEQQPEIKDEPIKQLDPINIDEIKDEQTKPQENNKIPDEQTKQLEEQTKQPEQQDVPSNTEGTIDLNEIKIGDTGDFEQIPDKTTINTITTDSGVKIVDDKSVSDMKYPKTGANSYIVIAGIIVATSVAIVSYRKMKNEEK